MPDYNEYQTVPRPAWERTPFGEGWLLVLGHVKDAFVQAAKEAIKARLPLTGPADALPAIASDRGLERFAPETEAGFRVRLVGAWEAWQKGGTAQGIVDAIALTGLCTAVVYADKDIDLGPGSWARFIVVLSGSAWAADGIWDDPGDFDDEGGTWDSTATIEEAAVIKRQVAVWHGEHAHCLGLVVLFGDAALWDLPPGDWDDGTWDDDDDSAVWQMILPEGNAHDDRLGKSSLQVAGACAVHRLPHQHGRGRSAPAPHRHHRAGAGCLERRRARPGVDLPDHGASLERRDQGLGREALRDRGLEQRERRSLPGDQQRHDGAR